MEVNDGTIIPFGFCISKTATKHDEILTAINDVIEETDITAVLKYYLGVSQDIVFPDLSDNTDGVLDVYTSPDFPPFEVMDNNGDINGVDIYLMRLVAEKLNMKMTIYLIDFDSIVGVIATKDNAIGAAGISITAERAESVDFSDPYFTDSQFYTVCNKQDPVTTWGDLAGKTVGIISDSSVSDFFNVNNYQLFKDIEMINVYSSSASAFSALRQGVCDVLIVDPITVLLLPIEINN